MKHILIIISLILINASFNQSRAQGGDTIKNACNIIVKHDFWGNTTAQWNKTPKFNKAKIYLVNTVSNNQRSKLDSVFYTKNEIGTEKVFSGIINKSNHFYKKVGGEEILLDTMFAVTYVDKYCYYSPCPFSEKDELSPFTEEIVINKSYKTGIFNNKKTEFEATTTIKFDDPIDVNINDKRLSAKDGILHITTNDYKSYNHTEVYIQVSVDNNNWHTIETFKRWKSQSLKLTYEQITRKNGNYYNWLGKGLSFRIVKKLRDGSFTYGKTQSSIIFFPEGIQYSIEHVRRTACGDSKLVIYTKLDNPADASVLEVKEKVKWKLRVKKNPNEELLASTFYTCTFEKVENSNKYKVITNIDGNVKEDLLNKQGVDYLLYGELMLQEVVDDDDDDDEKYNHCIKTFVIPPKPEKVEVSQGETLFEVDIPNSKDKNKYHLLSDEDLYAVLNIKDDYKYAHERTPYYMMSGNDTVSVVHELPYGYEDKKDSLDKEFETHFIDLLDNNNHKWALYLDARYNGWSNSMKDAFRYDGVVPSRIYPIINSGFAFRLLSDNERYFVGLVDGEYYKYEFNFSNSYCNCIVSNSGAGDENSFYINNEGVFSQKINGVKTYPTIKSTTITSNIVAGAGTNYLFTQTKNGKTTLNTLSLSGWTPGVKTEIVSDGKLPFYSHTGNILLYTKTDGNGLYKYGTSTPLSTMSVRSILYMPYDESYCIFRDKNYHKYKLYLTLPTQQYFLNKKSDTSDWPPSMIAILQEFKEIYKKQWLLEQCGYRLRFEGMTANTDYPIQLMDADGCKSKIANSFPTTADSVVHVAVPPQPSIKKVLLNAPTNTCTSNGKIRLVYNSGGINDYYYGNKQLKIGDSIEVSGLNMKDTLQFYTLSGDPSFVKYVDFSTFKNVDDPISYHTKSRRNKYDPDGEVTVSLTEASSASKTFILYNSNNTQEGDTSVLTTASTYTFKKLKEGDYTAKIVFDAGCPDLSRDSIEVKDEIFSLSVDTTASNKFSEEGKFDLTINNGAYSNITWDGSAAGIVTTEASTFTSGTFSAAAGSYQLIGKLNINNTKTVTDTVDFDIEAPSFKGEASIEYYEDGGNTFANFNLSLKNTIRLGDAKLTINKDGKEYDTTNGSMFQSALPAGNYIVHLDNDYEEIEIFDFTVSAQTLNSTHSITEANCPNSTVNITVGATGGISGGTITYGTDGSSFDSTKVYKGISDNEFTYYVQSSNTITDDTGGFIIEVTKSFTKQYDVAITRPEPVSAGVDYTNVTCNGRVDGSISLANITGGKSNSTYKFRVDQKAWLDTTSTQGNLAKGTYTVCLKDDANSCPEVTLGEIEIIEPELLEVKRVDIVHPICELKNGNIEVEVEGGNGVYQYVLYHEGVEYDNTGTQTYLGTVNKFSETLPYGEYKITVKDPLGCIADTIITLNQSSNPQVNNVNKTPVSCYGYSDGTAEINTITPSVPAAAPYTYTWSNGTTENVSGGWSSGFHTVKITDKNGCNSTHTFEIETPDELVIKNQYIEHPTCELANGTVNIDIDGGNSSYKYTWKKDGVLFGNTHNSFTPDSYTKKENILAYGEYEIDVVDNKGCSANTTITLNESSNPDINNIITSPVLCYGDSNGEAEIKDNDIVTAIPYAPYTITWSNNETGNKSVGWKSGTHSVTLSDSNGCSSTKNFTVNSPDELKVTNINIVQPTCELANGSISLDVTGGNETYKYNWLKNYAAFHNSGSSFSNNTNTKIEGILSDAEYQIKVTDPKGCSLDTIVELIKYANPSVRESDVSLIDAFCYGDSNGEVELSNIAGSSALERVVLLKEGIRQDSIYNLPAKFTGLTQGNYSLKLYDANTCESNQDYGLSIQQPQTLQLVIDTVRPVLHKDGSSAYVGCTVTGGNTGLKHILLKDASDNTIAHTEERSNYRINFENLSHGQYYLETTDRKACLHTTNNFTIEQPSETLTFQIVSKKDAQCKARTGSFTIEGKGGWGGYSYKKAEDYNFFANNEFTGEYAGKYLVSVQDKMGAVYTGEVEISEPAEFLQLKVQDTQLPSCNNNGAVELLSTGGTAPYQIMEIDGKNSVSVDAGESHKYIDLEANIYTFKTIDAKGCIYNADVTLGEEKIIRDLKLTPSYPSAPGVKDGSLSATFLGGQAPFTYTWSTGGGTALNASGATIHNLSPGFYALTIQDNTGCSIHTQTYLPGAYDIALSVIEKGDETSYLAQNGYATLKFEQENYKSASVQRPDGTITSYTATDVTKLFNAQKKLNLNSLSGGEYSIWVEDKNGESYFANFSIKGYEEFLFRNTETTPALQRNSANGSALVTVKGGAPDYTYTWRNLETNIEENGTSQGSTTQLKNVKAGNYQITVTDKYNNQISKQVEILEPQKDLNISISDYRHESCKTYEDAYIQVNAEGGWGDYQFKHADEQYFNNAMRWNNLNVRTHTLFVSDKYGVTDTVSFEITEPDYLTATVNVVDSVNCNGNADGEIEFIIKGGTAPYRFAQSTAPSEWTNGNLDKGLAEGNYTYYFTDAHNCKELAPVDVYMPQPDVLDFALIDVTHTTCNTDNGKLEVAMKGGSVPYRYEWYDANNKLMSEENSVSDLAQKGSYRINVYDYHNCHVGHNQFINPSTNPQINSIITNPVLCYGDSNGTAEIEDAEPAVPIAPYHFIWSNSQEGESSSGWPSDIHSVTIIDDNNCKSTKNFTIASPMLMKVTKIYVEQPTCELANGTIKLNVIGGNFNYKYAWQKDDEAFYDSGDEFVKYGVTKKEKELAYGKYKINVKDHLGCFLDTTIILNESINPKINTINTKAVSCYGDSDGTAEIGDVIPAVPYAPYSFTWSNNQKGESSTGWVSGSHSVTITDANNCKITKEFIIDSPDLLKVASLDVVQPTCELANGTISLDVGGGNKSYKYSWKKDNKEFYFSKGGFTESTNSKIVQKLAYGEYTIDVEDHLGCFIDTTITLNRSVNPKINTINTSPVLCYGDSNGTAQIVDVVPAIPYAPYSYTWSNGQKGANSTGWTSDTHSVTITDENNCATTKYFSVETPDPLNVSINSFKDAHCYGYNDGYIEVNPFGGVGGYTYLWSNGDTEAKAKQLSKGEYSLQLKDANNCIFEKDFVVDEPEEAIVNLGEDIEICPGNIITIDGKDFSAHRWTLANGNVLSEERHLSTGDETDYYLRVTNSIGCYAYDTISIKIGDNALKADFLLSSETNMGDTLRIYEVSNLVLDSMKWDYNRASFFELNNEQSQDYVLELETLEEGMFNIELQAYSGGCVSKVIKQVEVVQFDGEIEDIPELGYQEPLIQSIRVAPNPTDGNFDVIIELREEADVKVDIFNVNEGVKVNEKKLNSLKKYTVDYHLSHLSTGVYLVVVTAEKERKQVKIIIK